MTSTTTPGSTPPSAPRQPADATSSADGDSLDAFYADLPAHHMQPLWTIEGALTVEPTPRLAAHLWRYRDVRSLLLRASPLISAEDADRRVLTMRNPAMRDQDMHRTTDCLWAAMQLVLPGEIAPAHRHTPAALRYIVEGTGAYTRVDGWRVDMTVGDVVVTPSGTWHEHGHDGEGPMIWLDGLDLPLVHNLHAVFAQFDGRPVDRVLPPTVRRDNAVVPRYGLGDDDAPMLVWSLADVEAALLGLADGPGDPYDDLVVEYTDPRTGGPLMPTLGGEMQMLRPGVTTQRHQHTYSVIHHVARGTGRSHIGDTVFEWEPGDTFAVPSWLPHHHENPTSEPAMLFAFTDRPVLEKLGLWYEKPGSRTFR